MTVKRVKKKKEPQNETTGPRFTFNSAELNVPIIIHVNRHRVLSNKKHADDRAVWAVRQGKNGKARYCKGFTVYGALTGITDYEQPLKCGATSWLMVEKGFVVLIDEETDEPGNSFSVESL